MKKNKLVFGVGINDVDYVTEIRKTVGYVNGKRKEQTIWICPAYQDWKHVLERCYSEKLKQKRPTYKDVMCCEEWLHLSVFKDWMDTQGDVKDKHLDKDIIIPGNKLYSPDTCAYVNQLTNSFVTACDASRGDHLLGVNWYKPYGKFLARCSNPFTKKTEHLGYFYTEQEAHEAWRQRKHELAQFVAATEDDVRVVEALKRRYSVEDWYKNIPM